MYTVGQKLFYVLANRYRRVEPTEVTVTAVGRKWVTFKDGSITMRFELTDRRMSLDGGGGRCYLSREDYEAEQAVERRWASLIRWVNARQAPPAGVTVERIDKALDVLQVEHLPLMGATNDNC